MNYRTLKFSFLANLLAASWIIPATAQDLTVKDGLQLWLKADAGVTAAAGKVTAWADQSGKGNNASQATGDSSPELVPAAVNGKPALRFDGVDDFLEVADSDSLSIAGDITTFFVVKIDDFATYRAVWAKTKVNQPGPNDWYTLPNTGVPRAYRGDGNGANTFGDGGKALTTGQYLVAGWGMAGSYLTHYLGGFVNGGGRFLRTSVIADADTALLIGTRDDRVTIMKGDIAEVLIYNRALPAADRSTVLDYLNKKYVLFSFDPAGDEDKDGLTNLQEAAASADPTTPDTDGDGLSDGDEVNKYKSDPGLPDTDGDIYFSDGYEVNVLHTDPTKADTDGDTFSDYYEVHLLTDPLDANSKPTKTTANLFTGPDAGQGLDLTGTFPYAISFGTEDRAAYSTSDGTLAEVPPFGKIHDALFTADNVDGVTVESNNVADNWNNDVNFGNSPEQQILSSVMASIRWSDAASATPAATVTFDKLQVGASYKLQLLFGERLWARGEDVSINGRLIADDFAPYQWQGGFVGPGNATPRDNGVVLTHSFIPNSAKLTVLLAGRTVTRPEMGDHNAIINGATVELIAPAVDSDGDGLWDAWETESFGNLTQTATGDFDNDGLTNATEFSKGTDPSNPDTDRDGLKDGVETGTGKFVSASDTGTDPLTADADGDGLADGVETGTGKFVSATDTGTNPHVADTDVDLFNDKLEVTLGTDPNDKNSVFAKKGDINLFAYWDFNTVDPDKTLDLVSQKVGTLKQDAKFSADAGGYSGNAGDRAMEFGAAGQHVTVYGASFLSLAGVFDQISVALWSKQVVGNSTAFWGQSPASGGGRGIQSHLPWGNNQIYFDTAGCCDGTTQRIQKDIAEFTGDDPIAYFAKWHHFVLTKDGPTKRIYIDGELFLEGESTSPLPQDFTDLYLGALNDTGGNSENGSMDEFAVFGSVLSDANIKLLAGGKSINEVFGPFQPPATAPTLKAAKDQGNIVITFEGTLQVSDAVNGPYTDLAGSSPATVATSGSAKFYRAVRK